MSRTVNKAIKTAVVKLSGSLFKDDIKKSDLAPFIKVIIKLRKKGIGIVLVTGGGKNARNYIEAARNLGADESTLDEIGIYISRLNAMLLIAGIGKTVYSSVPTSLNEVSVAFSQKGFVVTGGLNPGQSTNATACLIAERINADIFHNATSVEYIYTKDPKTHSDAERLNIVTIKDLKEVLSSSSMSAGTYELMDLVALNIIERSSIYTRVTICKPEVIESVLNGEELGTLIIP